MEITVFGVTSRCQYSEPGSLEEQFDVLSALRPMKPLATPDNARFPQFDFGIFGALS